jgi:hypothetical protein
MQQLGYAVEAGAESCPTCVVELARSAARAHQLYLEQLSKLGIHATALQQVREELTKAAAARERLTEAQGRLSAQLAESEGALRRLRQNLWVKLGTTVGLVRLKRKSVRMPAPDNPPATTEAGATSAPLPNLQ